MLLELIGEVYVAHGNGQQLWQIALTNNTHEVNSTNRKTEVNMHLMVTTVSSF